MADISERKRHRSSGASDRVEVRIYNVNIAAAGHVAILAAALLICALLAGVAVSVIPGGSSLGKTDWNIIFIALGTLCLGFGSASVIYQYYRSQEIVALNAQYASLSERAKALLEEFNAYETGQKHNP